MLPKLENPNNLKLSTEVQQLILQLFNEYKRLIIRKIYQEGLSGGKVIEVQAIKADGTPELPAVIKVAAISLIQKEWQAYQQHIRYRLHNAANIVSEPTIVPEIGWGGLRYTLMGGGAFEVTTLRDYLFRDEVNARDASHLLQRLLRFMHTLWGHYSLSTNFPLAQSYAYLLPVDLLFQTLPNAGAAKVLHEVTPASLPGLSLVPGDWAQLSGFVINKVNPDTQTATLEQPDKGQQKWHHWVRWKASLSSDLNQYQLHQPVAALIGQVVETRLSRLQAEARPLLSDESELTAAFLQLPGLNDIFVANPLHHFEAILGQTTSANMASIHGDLNLANILVEPETGILSLVDFAEARNDHVLHDLLRLETEITTYLLAETARRHNWPPAAILGYLYWHLHGLAHQPAVDPPPHLPQLLEKPWALLVTIRQAARRYFCQANVPTEYYRGLYLYLLGALKFKNLNTLASAPWPKQMAFWGAALMLHFLTAAEADMALLATALKPLPGAAPAENKQLADNYLRPTYNGAAAGKLLASPALSLPLAVLPALSDLPANSRMLFGRNLLFVGRQYELRFLAHSFTTNPLKPVAITGLGGLGKTQLACEFVHRYGSFFTGGIFWLSFAEPKSVAAEVAACGAPGFMDLRPDFAGLPLQEQVDLVLAEWRRPLPRLLIFDNCEDPELLQQWRPATGGCHILITSRRADWGALLGVAMLCLDVLSRPESLALLREHYPDAEDQALAAIAQEVGDLPLALHLAGSFLARYRDTLSPAKYLERLRDHALHPKILTSDWSASPTEHIQNVSRTIALSYDQLNPEEAVDRAALQILARVSCLAHGEPVPYHLLELLFGLAKEDFAARLQLGDAVNRLVDLGLLRVEEQRAVRLHRLLVAYVHYTAEEQIRTAQMAVETALLNEAKRSNDLGFPTSLQGWQVHLQAVTKAAQARNELPGAQLGEALARHLRQSGDYQEAQSIWQRTLEIWRLVLGDNHPTVACTLVDLGDLYLRQILRDEAWACLQQALAIQLATIGEYHADTARTYNHMGYLRKTQKRWAEAQQYHERALQIRLQVLGTEHPDTAQSLINLARLDKEKQEWKKVEQKLEQAWDIYRRTLGEAHAKTISVRQYLGEVAQAQGKLAEAQKIFQQVLLQRQQLLGREHPQTAGALIHMGAVYQNQGDLEQALSCYEQALAIRLKILGPHHWLTAGCWVHLGDLSCENDNIEAAKQYYQQALQVFEAYNTTPEMENIRQKLRALSDRDSAITKI